MSNAKLSSTHPVKKYLIFKALRNQDKFNKHGHGRRRPKRFKGTDGTVGIIYAWKGGKDAVKGKRN